MEFVVVDGDRFGELRHLFSLHWEAAGAAPEHESAAWVWCKSRVVDGLYICYAVYDGGRPIAYVLWILTEDYLGTKAEILQIYTDSPRLGRRLFMTVEVMAVSLGANRIGGLTRKPEIFSKVWAAGGEHDEHTSGTYIWRWIPSQIHPKIG